MDEGNDIVFNLGDDKLPNVILLADDETENDTDCIRIYQVPCENAPFGCTEMLTLNEKKVHQAFCDFKLCYCPFPTSSGNACQWKGVPGLLLVHVEDFHNTITIIDGVETTFRANDIDTLPESDWFLLVRCHGHHFIVTLHKRRTLEGDTQYIAYIRVIGTRTQATRYYYEFEFIGESISIKREANVRSLHEEDRINGISDCFVFDSTIDFSKVVIKLYTKQGILRDQTNCAPNSGYYFIPLYDKGDYVLELEPPPGWSFEPTKINLAIDRENDICSRGQDINFVFKGFGITGKVESAMSNDGPAGIEVKLESDTEVRTIKTGEKGVFFFTPVYPGNYKVSISHSKWNFIKQSISVTVTEGNTDLPAKSLVVAGYNVRGVVKSDGDLIKGAILMLHGDKKSLTYIIGCDKTPVPNIIPENNYLCHVLSNEQGVYEISSIPTGNYNLIPFYKGENIHFLPISIEFNVSHGTVEISKPFEIIGFSVNGRVLSHENGTGLNEATIYLDGEKKTISDSKGSYTLEKVKAGNYTLVAKADNYQFEQKTLRINPNLLELPDMFPLSYLVCGSVISENSQTVVITRVGSSQHTTVHTKIPTGKFCEYLKPGKYNVQVIVSDQEKQNGIQFFPILHTIEVTNNPILDISFSQLKATISGKLQTLRQQDRVNISVVLRPILHDVALVDKDIVGHLVGDSYTFKDIRPGMYEVLLSPNSLCWKEDKQLITVSSSILTVPTFVQNGYLVIFTSTHDTEVIYKLANQTYKILDIPRGRSTQCVEESGKYSFKLESCHVYETDVISYDTANNTNEIYITAIKHKNTLYVSAEENVENVTMTVNIGGIKTVKGPLIYKDKKYALDVNLSSKETAILIPQSDILYFNPPILQIEGTDDCADLGTKFEGVKGRVFKGKVIPPLAGVQITITSENSDTLMDETDVYGNYKFPPLDDSKSYQISAVMDSYVLIGPNGDGDFLAHKLAEITVEVIDQVDNKPLQGALLSLSGAQSYRSNLQTNADGKISFSSLSPSEYFLRPMMKEYSFEPSSKIINVEEGASVSILLRGKRIAYSAFGQITSLNGEPEEKIIVVASGVGNCSQYSEESSSESNGQFRIRGLLPYCTYDVKVKGSLDDKEHFERASPSIIRLEHVKEDIDDLKLVIFKPPQNTDILVKIYAVNPDHYRSFKVKVSRESSPSGLIHMTKIDTNYKIARGSNPGILIQLPTISLDNKMYSVQLESVLPQYSKLKPPIEYFTANSSFKYVKLEYYMRPTSSDHHIKQTSIWTLLFIFCGVLSVYNIDKILALFKQNFLKFNVDAFINLKTKAPEKDVAVNNHDIDQIVQSINATKKKPKPKKI
ncbi:hypothetical protein Trydic_g5084 [Trypoxylus dichotomus]